MSVIEKTLGRISYFYFFKSYLTASHLKSQIEKVVLGSTNRVFGKKKKKKGLNFHLTVGMLYIGT